MTQSKTLGDESVIGPIEPLDRLAADGMMATRTTYYAALYPRLREVARQHGYALCIHGTLARDLDVVAVPWVADASTEAELVAALVERTGGAIGCGPEHRTPKPHGRQAWVISLLGGGGYVDLSIMPLQRHPQQESPS